MANNLQLTLIKKWFDLTKSGEKTEDYREITSFWCNRLLLFDGKSKNKSFWENEFLNVLDAISFKNIVNENDRGVSFKPVNKNIMTLGYPSFDDRERYLYLDHKGIEIGTGRPDWGADPNKYYFVIKHGKIIE
jgi:hypothetical protein